MRILDPKLPLDNPRMAKMAAETIVCCGFNATRAARELRPDLKAHRNFAHRLMREPAVKKEIEKIMSQKERNPEKYMDSLWAAIELYEDYLTRNEVPPKHVVEVAQTAMRLLGRGFISEKGAAKTPSKPMVIAGVGAEINNLTGDPEKVM